MTAPGMFCPRCGQRLDARARVCPVCGADLTAVRRFFRVAGGPTRPGGYLVAAAVCGLLAVLFWGPFPVAALVCAVFAALALVVAVVARGVQVGHDASRRR